MTSGVVPWSDEVRKALESPNTYIRYVGCYCVIDPQAFEFLEDIPPVPLISNDVRLEP